MRRLYWPFLLFAAGFLLFVHTHTDEVPVVLSILLLTSAALSAAFPRQFLFSGLTMGITLFVAEMLVYFSLLHAPYPVRSIPWAALAGYLPAVLGTAIGAGSRRLFRPQRNS